MPVELGLLEISSQPYSGRNPEPQFSNKFRSQYITNIHRVVFSTLEVFEPLLFQYFGVTDDLETAGWKSHGGARVPFESSSLPISEEMACYANVDDETDQEQDGQ